MKSLKENACIISIVVNYMANVFKAVYSIKSSKI